MTRKRDKKNKRRQGQQPLGRSHLLVIEHPPGIEDLARRELTSLGRNRVRLATEAEPSETAFMYQGSPTDLLKLRLSAALYQVHHFAVPRPKALLGHEHWQRFLAEIAGLLKRYPAGTFHTFRIAAAGRFSAVFRRIRETLAKDSGLSYDEDEADLQIRIRPAQLRPDGWELLLRLTPRPLNSRPWRLFNYKGAVNGVIAAAMVEMSQPKPTERVLNLMCGSGTLLIERALRQRAELLVGLDLDREALAGAQQNGTAAEIQQMIHLFTADVRANPLPAASFDTIMVDPPWGQLVGDQDEPSQLYPELLVECQRLLRPGGQLLLLTHQIHLWQQTMASQATFWQLQAERQIFQGGLHPRIYHYRKNTSK